MSKKLSQAELRAVAKTPSLVADTPPRSEGWGNETTLAERIASWPKEQL